MEITAGAETAALHEPEAGKLGIWIFILSEIMLFGGFFSSYFMIRLGSSACALGTPAWPKAGYTGGLALAALNTLILITSSFTMVNALAASKRKDGGSFSFNLLATILLGCAFLAVKAFEYTLKIHHGYFPGSILVAANPGLGIFFSFYFAMTGLHALHVVVGLLWNSFLYAARKSGEFSDAYTRKMEYAGLYWHFVDVVWVFLFPLFYLV